MTRLAYLVAALTVVGCGARGLGTDGGAPDAAAAPDLAQPPGADLAGVDLAGGGGADYRAVWGSNANDVWIAGTSGAVLHGGGGGFAQVPNLPAVDYYGVSGGLAQVLLVGAQGTILVSSDHGASFAPVASGTTAALRGCSMVFGRETYVVGDAGTMLVSHDGGLTFATVTLPTAADLTAVRVFSDGDAYEVFAVGKGGTILHGAAGMWTVTPEASDLYAVWAAGPQNAFAGADNSNIEGGLDTVLRLDSTGSWQVDFGSAGFVVYGLDASDADNVWAAGNMPGVGGLVLHRSAAGWKGETLQGGPALRGAWVYAAEVYLVGDAGTILHNPPPP